MGCLSQHEAAGGAALAHLEHQRAAGTLRLGSVERAAQLAMAAAWRGHTQLLQHAVAELQALLAGGAQAGRNSLFEVVASAVDGCAPAVVLPLLLASGLPFATSYGGSLLGWLARKAHRHSYMPLVHQAAAAAGLPARRRRRLAAGLRRCPAVGGPPGL